MSTKTLLRGHVSPQTAYFTDDYPYGGLRCHCRWWIEIATKGAGKGKMRVAQQTTNPKTGNKVWNKPHYGTYSSYLVLLLNEQNHVQVAGFNRPVWPDHLDNFKKMFEDQLNQDEIDLLARFETESRKLSPISWEKWDQLQLDQSRSSCKE